jgi:hypothetical protein
MLKYSLITIGGPSAIWPLERSNHPSNKFHPIVTYSSFALFTNPAKQSPLKQLKSFFHFTPGGVSKIQLNLPVIVDSDSPRFASESSLWWALQRWCFIPKIKGTSLMQAAWVHAKRMELHSILNYSLPSRIQFPPHNGSCSDYWYR